MSNVDKAKLAWICLQVEVGGWMSRYCPSPDDWQHDPRPLLARSNNKDRMQDAVRLVQQRTLHAILNKPRTEAVIPALIGDKVALTAADLQGEIPWAAVASIGEVVTELIECGFGEEAICLNRMLVRFHQSLAECKG